MGHVPQVAVAYTNPTRATLRCTQDVFDLPLWNGICIPQLQETAHVFTMHMPLTPQIPECFFRSAVTANASHNVVHNKFMALMHLQAKTGHYTCLLLVLFGRCSAQAVTHLSYLCFSADGLHRPLHMFRTCPFRRMVCTCVYTSLLLVLFGGWSARAITHLSYLSFSADGLHSSPTCPFPRMVCTGHYTSRLIVLFGGWSAKISYLSFSTDGLHRP